MKFGLVREYNSGAITGVRGWDSETEDRYEIDKHDGEWRCLRVVDHIADDGWGFASIPADNDLFACMIAAEADAKSRRENMQESIADED